VSFDLMPGRTLGIVGESGSGKSVTSLAVMGLLADTARVSGSVRLDGQELLGLNDTAMSAIRGKQMSMIFQDPLSSLTPVFSIGAQLVEALQIHNTIAKKDAWDRAVELLKLVGIPRAETRVRAFPHEFSGGMRQRVVIAIAMANNPKLIIADEPTTALDVTIQAQILEVIATAQRETGAAAIIITHDMGVVAGSADDVIVMYAGKPVEQAPINELFYETRMPYSIGLLAAIPRVDVNQNAPLVPIKGNPPLLINLPPGCPFVPRCPIAIEACRLEEPELLAVAPKGLGISRRAVIADSSEDAPHPLTGSRWTSSGQAPADSAGSTVTQHRAACIRAGAIEAGMIDGEPVYGTPELPKGELLAIPRAERPIQLEVRNLTKTFPLLKGALLKRRIGTVYAVNGVSFDIRQGETLAIVGESGCGKTTTLLEIMNLAKPPDGDIVVGGVSVHDLAGSGATRNLRRDLQIVFQDPIGALDPRLTVYDIIAEPMRATGQSSQAIGARVDELMELVGLDPAHSDRFPAAFSGGQRQRIAIARALSTNPKVVALDEPVSALDVSIQAGVINLLDEIKVKLGLSYLFVAHDLSVVRHIADRVAVMYLGKFVEYGDTNAVFDDPQHPYTQALLSAIPLPDPIKERSRSRIVLAGDLPSPVDNSPGCRFVSRCQLHVTLNEDEKERCRHQTPLLTGHEGIHTNACHYR
jgi:peptide/nickel transport system ATP-binding protein